MVVYAFVRVVTQSVTDYAFTVLGQRLNVWAAVAVIAGALLVLWRASISQASRLLGPTESLGKERLETGKERLEAEVSARGSWGVVLTGVLAVLAIFTAASEKLDQDLAVPRDKEFHDAVTALNASETDDQVSAIYTLQRLASEAPRLYAARADEVLAAFIRNKAPLADPETANPATVPPASAALPLRAVLPRRMVALQGGLAWCRVEECRSYPSKSVPPAPSTNANDLRRPIQAALLAIIAIPGRDDLPVCIDLSKTNLDRMRFPNSNLSNLCLNESSLVDADLHGATLDGGRLDLSGAILTGANLRDAHLEGAELTGAYLVCTQVQRANLSRASLRGAYLVGANFRDAILQDLLLESAHDGSVNGFSIGDKDLKDIADRKVEIPISSGTTNLTTDQATIVVKSNLAYAILAKMNCPKADQGTVPPEATEGTPGNPTAVFRADFTGANLSGAQLNGADLRGVLLTSADLTGANLKPDLTGAITDMRSANLDGAKLNGAEMHDANLGAAELKCAQLQPAGPAWAQRLPSLFGGYLQSTVLTNAKLDSAVLAGANLSSAILDGADLKDVHHNYIELTDEVINLSKQAIQERSSGRFDENEFKQNIMNTLGTKDQRDYRINLAIAISQGVICDSAKPDAALGVNSFRLDLSSANLTGVNLEKANLENADLANANFTDSNPQDAASLRHTNMSGVTGLDDAQKQACVAKGAIGLQTPDATIGTPSAPT